MPQWKVRGSLVLPAVFATLLGSIDGGRHEHPTGHGDGSELTEAFAKLRDPQHSLDCLQDTGGDEVWVFILAHCYYHVVLNFEQRD